MLRHVLDILRVKVCEEGGGLSMSVTALGGSRHLARAFRQDDGKHDANGVDVDVGGRPESQIQSAPQT